MTTERDSIVSPDAAGAPISPPAGPGDDVAYVREVAATAAAPTVPDFNFSPRDAAPPRARRASSERGVPANLDAVRAALGDFESDSGPDINFVFVELSPAADSDRPRPVAAPGPSSPSEDAEVVVEAVPEAAVAADAGLRSGHARPDGSPIAWLSPINFEDGVERAVERATTLMRSVAYDLEPLVISISSTDLAPSERRAAEGRQGPDELFATSLTFDLPDISPVLDERRPPAGTAAPSPGKPGSLPTPPAGAAAAPAPAIPIYSGAKTGKTSRARPSGSPSRQRSGSSVLASLTVISAESRPGDAAPAIPVYSGVASKKSKPTKKRNTDRPALRAAPAPTAPDDSADPADVRRAMAIVSLAGAEAAVPVVVTLTPADVAVADPAPIAEVPPSPPNHSPQPIFRLADLRTAEPNFGPPRTPDLVAAAATIERAPPEIERLMALIRFVSTDPAPDIVALTNADVADAAAQSNAAGTAPPVGIMPGEPAHHRARLPTMTPHLPEHDSIATAVAERDHDVMRALMTMRAVAAEISPPVVALARADLIDASHVATTPGPAIGRLAAAAETSGHRPVAEAPPAAPTSPSPEPASSPGPRPVDPLIPESSDIPAAITTAVDTMMTAIAEVGEEYARLSGPGGPLDAPLSRAASGPAGKGPRPPRPADGPVDLDEVAVRVSPRMQEPAATEPSPVVLRASSLSCRGPAGLTDVSFDLHRGEVLALVGDHGSGAERLSDILAGDVPVAAGSIVLSSGTDEPLVPMKSGSRTAMVHSRIALIRSTAALAPSLTGLQNIAIGARSLFQPRLFRRKLRGELTALQRDLDFRVPLDTPVAGLPAGDRLLLEVLRAVCCGARIIVFEDVLSSLTMREAEQLFRAIKRLAAEGKSIVLATRQPEAAMAVADRIIVFRSGRKITEINARSATRGTLTAYLAGRVIERARPAPHPFGRSAVELSLVNAGRRGSAAELHTVSLDVRGGEILGIAGTPGNGQETLTAVISGAEAPSGGWIKLHGKVPRYSDPALFRRAGVGVLPQDALRQGLVASMSIAENLILDRLRSRDFSRFGLIRREDAKVYARSVLSSIELPASDPSGRIDRLPGDAARKLLVLRTLAARPHIIVAHDPTDGLSSADREAVHRMLLDERDDGAAIILISNDVDELFALSDSIGVLYRGRLSVPQPAGAFDHQNLSLMMGGQGSMAHDWSGWGGAAQ